MPQPEQTFRIGSVSASVFLNQTEDGRPFRTVSLQRRYKVGDEWKSAANFSLNELPAVATVVQLATQYVASQEAVAAPAESDA